MSEAATTTDRLLSAKSVRELLDVSDRGLRRWVAAGKFPPADLRIGRNLRWRKSTVDAVIRGEFSLDTEGERRAE